MKRFLCLCFIAGLAAGSWIPGLDRVRRVGHASSSVGVSKASPAGEDWKPLPSIRQTKDRMEISRERLKELLETSTVLSIDSFYHGMQTGGWQNADRLAKWAQLDAGEKQALTKILTEAAKARTAWEKANVKVESSAPGKWMLRFPGDQGKARDDLRRKIESTFPAEKATAIWFSGDLDNFFGLSAIWPEFKNGQVEVMSHTSHEAIYFRILAPDREILFEIASPDLENNPYFGRLLGLLGTPEDIRKSAAKANRGGPVPQ